ncbi:MAG TPA: trypsin-like peptidase domain-containing protein [Methylomirabilota bacterium]|nr:trypsin-like peptidase domain-containing protein [Methylomirabilota bacterium]
MPGLPTLGVLLLVGPLLASVPSSVWGEGLPDVFQRVTGSVVVVRAKGRDLVQQGANSVLVKFNEVGSGVLASADGKVLTAAHVVQIADEMMVEFLGGEAVPARVVSSEPRSDLALLQLARVPAGVKPAQLGDSASTRVGEQVFIVGAPYGIAHSLTVGYLSARHKPNTIYAEMPLAEFLQTDAAINQGNSGGPMFNMRGEVIGIVSHIISKSGGFEGLGFVVSSNMVRQLMLEKRPFWTGVTWFRVNGELAKYLNLPQPFGLLVEEVAKSSPGEAIGLRPSHVVAKLEGKDLPLGGDIVLEAMGIRLDDETSFDKVRDLWAHLRSGDEMTFKVFRAGQVVELKGRLP